MTHGKRYKKTKKQTLYFLYTYDIRGNELLQRNVLTLISQQMSSTVYTQQEVARTHQRIPERNE